MTKKAAGEEVRVSAQKYLPIAYIFVCLLSVLSVSLSVRWKNSLCRRRTKNAIWGEIIISNFGMKDIVFSEKEKKNCSKNGIFDIFQI